MINDCMKAGVILRANGTREWVAPTNGKFFSLKELQGFVCGFAELVHLKNDKEHVLIVNEEGKLRNEPLNKDASIIAQVNDIKDIIVGDAFYCRKELIK